MEDVVWAAVGVSLGNVLVGGASQLLSLYLEPLREFNARVGARKSRLLVQLAGHHAELLRDLARATDEPLRSFVVAPRAAEPDKIDTYTTELLRVVTVHYRLRELSASVTTAHHLLLATTVLGIFALLLAVFFPETKTYVLFSSVIMLVFQMAAICTAYRTARVLDDYEDLT